jgi:hypothetical protein
MANTTFAGPIRSEGGFTTISKNGTTGAISTLSSINSSGFASLDANTMAVEAGTGITTGSGTLYRSSVQRVGGIITTRILIDLTGLRSTAELVTSLVLMELLWFVTLVRLLQLLTELF